MTVVHHVFTALSYISPDFNTPVTPGSRYEGYVRQYGNRVSESASQTEEDDSQAAGDSESNKESANPGKTVREILIEEHWAAADTPAPSSVPTSFAAPSSVPTSFGPACQTSAPPFKSAPSPPPPGIETKPATLPNRNPPKPKGVTPVPSPMPVIPETGQDAQEEPASQEPQQDQPVPDHAGWPPGWPQQSNNRWRNWNNWGWARPRGVPW